MNKIDYDKASNHIEWCEKCGVADNMDDFCDIGIQLILKIDERYTKNYLLVNKAIENGCEPIWDDNYAGWCCSCLDKTHYSDQNNPLISIVSASKG